jgi:CheY-like chemotaxis protein
VRRVLSEVFAIVDEASDVSDALLAVAANRPHVLVSDIGLPRQGGLSLVRQLRRLGYDGSSLPAIALTAYATPEDRERSLEAGFQVHLTKPVDAEALRLHVASLVRR